MPFFQKIVQDKKYTTQQKIEAIRQTYGLGANDTSSEFVETILRDLGLVVPKKDNNINQKDLDKLIEETSMITES